MWSHSATMASLNSLIKSDSDSSHSESEVSGLLESCSEVISTDSENLQDHAALTQQSEAETQLSCAAGQPFLKRVTEVLEALYSRGMTGLGKPHNATVEVAVSSTGLIFSQVKIICNIVITAIPQIYRISSKFRRGEI